MIRFFKRLFCRHDWQAHGAGYIADDPHFAIAYHDLICLKCGKEDNVAQKKYADDLAKREEAVTSVLAERKRKARREARLRELGKEPAS